MSEFSNNFIEELRAIVGATGVLEAKDVSTRLAGVWRKDTLQAGVLVRPANTQEVSKVMRLCHEQGRVVVTQGGLTGLVHGADAGPHDVILSLERMRNIERIDPLQRTATVQAGVVLQAVQEAADQHDLAFPLDLGARGTATIGGNASTNAGGNRVIRYGMTREMVLGLEAVLADGTVIDAMNQLIKNNAGYDLKHLFIGAEGTLGVITRLVLRLREKPSSTNMAFVALDSFNAVTGLLKHMDRALGGSLSAFEVMWQAFYQLVTSPPAKGQPPVPQDHPFFVLVESQGADEERDGQRFSEALESVHEAGLIADAAIAQSQADCRSFWALRDDVQQTMLAGQTFIFDISMPIAEMQAYVEGLHAALPAAVGEHKLWVFGHLGDGNLHVVVQVPDEDNAVARAQVESLVYAPLGAFSGSVSAEHGVGLEKKAYLHLSRSAEQIELMRTLKKALDPKGILNPGKIF